MSDKFDPIVFFDTLSEEEQAALQDELAGDPERAEALSTWKAARTELRERLRERVPDRSLLVLYALDHAGRTDLLTDEEKVTLEEARPDLEAAMTAHPGLSDVVRRIERGQNDFEAVWTEHMGAPAKTSSHRRAPDREPATSSAKRQGKPWRRWASRTALGLAAFVFVALIALLIQRDQGMVTVTASDGSTRLVELNDGSSIRLAAGATLTYPDPDEQTVFARRANLKGRAFFDVAPQEHSFHIETPTAVATVMGTSFGLDARDTMTTLVGVSGHVRLANRETRERAVIVGAGQRSRVARNARPSTPISADVSKALAWTNLFLFTETPAAQIAKRLSAFYEVTVTAAPSLAAKKVTGTFERGQPVREVLQVLAATLQAKVQKTADGYQLSPAASSVNDGSPHASGHP